MIKLLFYKGTKRANSSSTFWDHFICAITDSEFSHVELVLEDHGNGLFKCISSSTRDKGVRIKVIDIASGHWVVGSADRYVDEAWLRSQLGKRYDYIGLVGTIVKTSIFASNSKQFCSRLIAEALGLDKAWNATPKDLFEIT
jgi:hypothetical protein